MNRIRLNAIQTLTIGFAVLVLTGAILLSLPAATRDGGMPFLNALFTSTSASCVTGLSVYDTFSQFTLFGQVVLLLLIQTGGLGFMAIFSMVSFFLQRRIGLHERSILMESIGALELGGVVRLTRRILSVALTCEGIGAVLLGSWFCPRYGWYGVWMSIFHSVSAFCNAGFDLMGYSAPGTSLSLAADNWLVMLTIMALVLIGGLGFLVWDDVLTKGTHWSKFRLHTKIILSMSVIMMVFGTVGFYLTERNAAFAGLSVGQKWLQAMFQSVTARTAGFTTIPLQNLSSAGMLWMLIQMVIGAGSGSTGGGLKMNTFAVLVLGVWSYTRRAQSVHIFRRRLNDDTVRRAYFAGCQYFLVCFAGCMVLCIQGAGVVDALFEAVSALSTVGLTLGITSQLPAASKLAMIILMFAGRVGSLSVAMAMTGSKPTPKLRPPAEKILIG